MSTKTQLTYEEFRSLPDDGQRYELVDGEVVMAPSPSEKHQNAVGSLFSMLRTFVHSRALGKVYVAPFDVVFDELNALQPDVLFISAEHIDRITDECVIGAPDLAIEVLSEGTRRHDRAVKMPRYAKAGVSECWLVAPQAELIEIYSLKEGQYALTGRYGRGEQFASEVISGFVCRVDQIFD